MPHEDISTDLAWIAHVEDVAHREGCIVFLRLYKSTELLSLFKVEHGALHDDDEVVSACGSTYTAADVEKMVIVVEDGWLK